MTLSRIVLALTMFLATTVYAQRPVPLLDQIKKTQEAPEAKPAEAAPADVASLVARYGTIVSHQSVGAGNLTAWTVEKAGKRTVLYTTDPLGQNAPVALFAGVVWDARTGRNLSDPVVKAAQTAPPALTPPVDVASLFATPLKPVPAMDGTFSGELPESIKTVGSLRGVREGKGGPGDRVYIVIDPRCPFCRETYANTRKYVAAGASITWIPVLALGDPDGGLPLAATLIESDDPATLKRVLSTHKGDQRKPKTDTVAELRRSLAFLFAAYEANNSGRPGVPVAFFVDHRTGKARMVPGVSDDLILADIFGAHP